MDGTGLRGITYVELDGDGKISYVQEGCETPFKLDKLLETILSVLAKGVKDDGSKPPELKVDNQSAIAVAYTIRNIFNE